MLELNGVTKRFGGLVAVNNIDMAVNEGEILGLVGPNGAGKTTLLNLISGIYRPDQGSIMYQGEDITRLNLNRICKKGISKTFQQTHSFPEFTACQSVMISALFGNGRTLRMEDAKEEAASHLLDIGFPKEKINSPVRNLNVIELRRIQLARALASNPRVLLLDELLTGLNPSEGTEAIALIKRLRDRGITIVMIEHVMRVILGVSDRIVVLNYGEKIADGRPDEVINDPKVIESYLGERYSN